MGKLLKGVVKFSVAAATVGGVCYVFKDKIKQSKFYQEYDVDGKLDKVKSTIKEKLPTFDDETDYVDDDEIFFDNAEADGSRDYVSLNSEDANDTETASDTEDTADSKKVTEVAEDTDAEEADDTDEEIPTIDL